MKNLTLKLLVMIFCEMFTLNVNSQTQLKKWYFASTQVDMTPTIPHISSIPNSSVSTVNYGTGMYKSDNLYGLPQFYISDGNVYDGKNNLFGTLSAYQPSISEIAIVPFDGNNGCGQDKYYIIYTSSGFINSDVMYSIVDMNASSCGTVINGGALSTIFGNFCGIAVGKLSGGQRFAYIATGEEIYKMVITNSSISTPQQIAHIPNEFFQNVEMDISPDGSMLAFVYERDLLVTNPYHIIFLNSSGNFVSHVSYNVGNNATQGGRGVEFYKEPNGNIKLMVGAGMSGIFSIDPNNPTTNQIQVNNTQNYGYSQIELASNGKIYAAGPTDIMAIDINGTSPIINPLARITLTAPSISLWTTPSVPFYTLVDQIDDEDINPITKGTMCLDLYTKDDEPPGPDDTGEEPNPDWGAFYLSKDIFVHPPSNPSPAGHIHYNPEFDQFNPGVPHWAFVTVRNPSCRDYNAATGDVIHLYWAKASTALSWPYNWTAGNTISCTNSSGVSTTPDLGGEILPPQPIPNIPAGGSVDIPFQWVVPDPDPYFGCSDWQHFCLLSTIEATSIDDVVLGGLLGTSTWTNTKNFNNIAWKNMTIVAGGAIVANEECNNDARFGGTIGIMKILFS
jgi:hypothetical protein